MKNLHIDKCIQFAQGAGGNYIAGGTYFANNEYLDKGLLLGSSWLRYGNSGIKSSVNISHVNKTLIEKPTIRLTNYLNGLGEKYSMARTLVYPYFEEAHTALSFGHYTRLNYSDKSLLYIRLLKKLKLLLTPLHEQPLAVLQLHKQIKEINQIEDFNEIEEIISTIDHEYKGCNLLCVKYALKVMADEKSNFDEFIYNTFTNLSKIKQKTETKQPPAKIYKEIFYEDLFIYQTDTKVFDENLAVKDYNCANIQLIKPILHTCYPGLFDDYIASCK